MDCLAMPQFRRHLRLMENPLKTRRERRIGRQPLSAARRHGITQGAWKDMG